MSDLPLWTGWLIELREGRGWSRPNLAARLRDLAHDLPADLGVGPVAESSLESIEKAVGRWETKGIVPSDRYCILLTHAYATSNGEATMGDGSLGVQVFNLSGRLAFNLRDHASAKAFHQDAETIVLSELRDGGFKRWWLSSRARIARYNNHDLDEALYFAKQACRQPDGTSDYAAAWSFCVLAQMYSLNGSELKARKAIDLARVHAKGDAKDDPGAYLFPESRYGGLEAVRARISAYEGTCLLRHGQLLQAEAALKQSLAGIPEAIEGQVSFLLADLATVYIRQANPDPEQAAALLTRGAEIVNRTGSAIPTKRINKARHELRPWSAEPFVLELDEVLFPPSTHI